jgi:hypothetical protein
MNTVRENGHIIQYLYNGTGLNPKYQANANQPGAFADLPAALETLWHKKD